MSPYHMWTKEEIRTVLELWQDSSVADIAAEIGVDPARVVYIAQQIRRAGYELPKKHIKGRTMSMVEDVIAEFEGKKRKR